MVSDQDFWDFCFVGVASIRLHPANGGECFDESVAIASKVASMMLEERRRVCRLGERSERLQAQA